MCQGRLSSNYNSSDNPLNINKFSRDELGLVQWSF